MKWVHVLLIWITMQAGLQAGMPRVYLDHRPEAVASGIHVLITHRVELERKWNVPGGGDLAAHLLEQVFRSHQREVDALGCEIQCYDYPFLPFDDYYTGPDRAFIRVRVPNDTVDEALALIDRVMREAVQSMEKHLQTAYRSCTMGNRMRSGLRAEADAAWRRVMLKERQDSALPLYFKGPQPDVDQFNGFLAEFFRPENLIITVVGGFDRSKVESALRTSWKCTGFSDGQHIKAATSTHTPVAVESAEIRVEGNDPNQAYLLLAIQLPDLQEEKREATARLLAAHLSKRVSFELRERQGLAYSMGAGLEEWDGNWWLMVRMATGPEKLNAAQRGLSSVVAKALREPIDSERLEILRNALRTKRLMKRLTSVNKAFFLGLDLAKGRRPGRADRVDRALATVNSTDLQGLVSQISENRVLIKVAPGQIQVPRPAGVPKH